MPSPRIHHYVARAIILLVMISLIAGMVGCVPLPSKIKIHDWYDLDAVRNNLSGSYILMNDLNSTTAGYEELASPTANGGKGWQPIGGTYNTTFTGTFNGQGYEISDLFVNRPDQIRIGLFGRIEYTAVVKNLGVVNVTVIGGNFVGGLVGMNFGTISNSYSTGSVTGYDEVGGLVGDHSWSALHNCYSIASVTGENDVGGLVGMNEATTIDYSYCMGTISDSYSRGNVTGQSSVGGLVGVTDHAIMVHFYSDGSMTGNNNVDGLVASDEFSTVSNSYSTGSVTGSSKVGGLVGEHYDGTVNNSYSTGSVTGNGCVGGLVGWDQYGDVFDSYSTGSVTGDQYVGGLVGWNEDGTVSNSFWDIQTSGQATSAGGTGKNTTEMQDIITFSGAGWNIITVALNETNPAYIWNIVNNVTYPFLSWQP